MARNYVRYGVYIPPMAAGVGRIVERQTTAVQLTKQINNEEEISR